MTSKIQVDYNFLKGCFAEVAFELKKKEKEKILKGNLSGSDHS